jgi:hypothetical protein
MEEMRPPDLTAPPLHVIFGAARDFGLPQPEIWDAVDETLAGGADSMATPSLDELTAALARRILARERRLAAERRRRALDGLG